VAGEVNLITRPRLVLRRRMSGGVLHSPPTITAWTRKILPTRPKAAHSWALLKYLAVPNFHIERDDICTDINLRKDSKEDRAAYADASS